MTVQVVLTSSQEANVKELTTIGPSLPYLHLPDDFAKKKFSPQYGFAMAYWTDSWLIKETYGPR